MWRCLRMNGEKKKNDVAYTHNKSLQPARKQFQRLLMVLDIKFRLRLPVLLDYGRVTGRDTARHSTVRHPHPSKYPLSVHRVCIGSARLGPSSGRAVCTKIKFITIKSFAIRGGGGARWCADRAIGQNSHRGKKPRFSPRRLCRRSRAPTE